MQSRTVQEWYPKRYRNNHTSKNDYYAVVSGFKVVNIKVTIRATTFFILKGKSCFALMIPTHNFYDYVVDLESMNQGLSLAHFVRETKNGFNVFPFAYSFIKKYLI